MNIKFCLLEESNKLRHSRLYLLLICLLINVKHYDSHGNTEETRHGETGYVSIDLFSLLVSCLVGEYALSQKAIFSDCHWPRRLYPDMVINFVEVTLCYSSLLGYAVIQDSWDLFGQTNLMYTFI